MKNVISRTPCPRKPHSLRRFRAKEGGFGRRLLLRSIPPKPHSLRRFRAQATGVLLKRTIMAIKPFVVYTAASLCEQALNVSRRIYNKMETL